MIRSTKNSEFLSFTPLHKQEEQTHISMKIRKRRQLKNNKAQNISEKLSCSKINKLILTEKGLAELWRQGDMDCDHVNVLARHNNTSIILLSSGVFTLSVVSVRLVMTVMKIMKQRLWSSVCRLCWRVYTHFVVCLNQSHTNQLAISNYPSPIGTYKLSSILYDIISSVGSEGALKYDRLNCDEWFHSNPSRLQLSLNQINNY